MTDLTLYHIAPSRSSTALWMLEEIGEPYDIHLLRMSKNESRAPAYLAINPMGKVPALRHKETLVTELGAVLMYMAEAFPAANLDVPPGDPQRGDYLKWHFFRSGVIEPAVVDKMLERTGGPASALGYGDFDTAMDVLAAGLHQGPYLLGDRFTSADVGVGAALHWAMELVGAIPPRDEFVAYVERIKARPAFQRAEARDDELAGE